MKKKSKVSTRNVVPSDADVLFEIGSEELPATNLADIFESASAEKTEDALTAKLRKAFEEKRVAFGSSHVWSTPRRIVFYLKKVAPAQRPREDRIKILSRDEAYSADGQPTDKFLNILKHRNCALDQTVISELNGKPTVFIKKIEPELKTETVLPEILKSLVRSLGFPKNMRWGERWEDGSEIYFPRPIRGFFCLYGEKSVAFSIGSMKARNKTSFFSKGERKSVTVTDIPSYFAALRRNGVILDPAERKKAIQKVLSGLVRDLGARLYDDPFLLNEVNFLVETPDGLSAPFDREFLGLPLEVLTVSMARKQRIFGVLDGKGQVLPSFLAILDGRSTAAEKKVISRNISGILRAKLQDSIFFYNEDIKAPLSKKREELKNLVFLKNAGSMWDKSERLMKMAAKISDIAGLSSDDRAALERACFLSKADLLTQMVGEFPELQGIMGYYYALQNGEREEAAKAIREQYLPRTAADKLPETLPGAILSILDKVDLITCCFGLGLEPSSSADPYGLRRSASAIVKIAIDRKIRLPFQEILAMAKERLDGFLVKDKEAALLVKLDSFFKDRFKAVLLDRGYREDLVDAVLGSRFGDFYEMAQRVEALSRIFSDRPFSEACKVVERTVNILKGSKESLPRGVDTALFTEDLESEVLKHYERYQERIRQATDQGDYDLATNLYAEAFFDILNRFFEKVFVNAEDLNVRRNLLILLRNVRDLYTEKIADLSKIRF